MSWWRIINFSKTPNIDLPIPGSFLSRTFASEIWKVWSKPSWTALTLMSQCAVYVALIRRTLVRSKCIKSFETNRWYGRYILLDVVQVANLRFALRSIMKSRHIFTYWCLMQPWCILKPLSSLQCLNKIVWFCQEWYNVSVIDSFPDCRGWVYFRESIFRNHATHKGPLHRPRSCWSTHQGRP